ncbi:WcaJ Sugar transferases involved in lipopolysaccharide synthesis [Candidatus Methylopumilus universalis]|uniref:sugar transferase n=1 Tax=Candidatus Methylopumilus universalis TaxID=2588536 RepID=UPI003BEF2A4F
MIKRLFDFFVASICIIVLIPLFFILYFLILWHIGQPVFFVQMRPGLQGKPFLLYKFRSMTNKKDAKGNLLSDAERLNIFGRFLRASSFDELPTLWNVIKGDMSLVGPRPLLMEYLPLYNKNQKRRHEVKPGITGWAQVNGRNAISWKKKFDFDIWYVDHHTFWIDLKIIALTLKKVFLREGITESGQVTMSKFTGNTK